MAGFVPGGFQTVTVSEDHRTAKTDSLGGFVLSKEPLLPGDTFVFRVKEAKVISKPYLVVGVTYYPPNYWIGGRTCHDLSWSVDTADILKTGLSDGDHVSVSLGKNRDVTFKINSTEYTGKFYNLPETPLWVAIDMCVKELEFIPKAPFLVDLEPKVTTVNSDITFELRTLKHTEIKWRHKNKLTSNSAKYGITYHGEQHLLTIKNCQLSDTGEVSAEGSYAGKQDLVTSTVKVFEKPHITFLKDVSVMEGKKAIFPTRIRGSPEPSVVWIHKGKRVASNMLEQHGNKYEFVIQKCSIDDAGEIEVQARNSFAMAEEKAILEVRVKPRSPKITELDDIQVNEGDDVTLSVDITGEPEPQVDWFLGKKKLVPDSNTSFVKMQNKHTLTLRNAQPRASGIIKVEAINSEGSVRRQAKLLVQEVLVAPRITGLLDQIVSKGKDAYFEAEVSGNPKPSVEWIHSGYTSVASQRYAIKQDGNMHMLTIRNCSKKDAGDLKLIAETKEKKIETKVHLTVREDAASVHQDDDQRHVFDIARTCIDSIQLPDGYFDSRFNVCFCEKCHTSRGDNLVYLRGVPSRHYGLPIGWCKFGLRMPSRADVIGVMDKWHVAFHGTRVESVEKILETGELLIPGDKTPAGETLPIPLNHWDPNHPDPNMRPPAGHDVKKFYFSPSIKYSGGPAYAPLYKLTDPVTRKEHQIRVAFQVRIKPDTYEVGEQTIGVKGTIDPLFPNTELEWSTDRRGVAILVGLLVKVEDVVGQCPSKAMYGNMKTVSCQKGVGDNPTYSGQFRIGFTHKTTTGDAIKIDVGESCLVLHQDGNQLRVIHSRINEPFVIPKYYVKKE